MSIVALRQFKHYVEQGAEPMKIAVSIVMEEPVLLQQPYMCLGSVLGELPKLGGGGGRGGVKSP